MGFEAMAESRSVQPKMGSGRPRVQTEWWCNHPGQRGSSGRGRLSCSTKAERLAQPGQIGSCKNIASQTNAPGARIVLCKVYRKATSLKELEQQAAATDHPGQNNSYYNSTNHGSSSSLYAASSINSSGSTSMVPEERGMANMLEDMLDDTSTTIATAPASISDATSFHGWQFGNDGGLSMVPTFCWDFQQDRVLLEPFINSPQAWTPTNVNFSYECWN